MHHTLFPAPIVDPIFACDDTPPFKAAPFEQPAPHSGRGCVPGAGSGGRRPEGSLTRGSSAVGTSPPVRLLRPSADTAGRATKT